MFQRAFKIKPVTLLALLFFLVIPLRGQFEDNPYKRFVRGVYASTASTEQHRENNDSLHINFTYGCRVPPPSDWCQNENNDYYCENFFSERLVTGYASKKNLESTQIPISLQEWKTTKVPNLLADDRLTTPSGLNKAYWIGEEHPEFNDGIFFDAMNFAISKIHEKFDEDDLITCCYHKSCRRPVLFLWVKGIDAFWYYPFPFNYSYDETISYTAYQDSLQARAVDPYNDIADYTEICRGWGSCPNLHWKACLQGWYYAWREEPDEIKGARKPTREEMLLEAWVAFSRGAKGIGYFRYGVGSNLGANSAQVGLVDNCENHPFIDDPDPKYQNTYKLKIDENTWTECFDAEVDNNPWGYDADDMFSWAKEVFMQFEGTDNNLKNEAGDFAFENGLFDLDVVDFRSEQGNMNSMGFVSQIVIAAPANVSEAYYEVSTFNSPREQFFLLLNRTMHHSSVTYNLKVTPPGPGYWKLIDVVTGTVYSEHDCCATSYFWENGIELGAGEAALFALKYVQGGSQTELTSTCRNATGFSNGRKIALSNVDGDAYTYLVYTDGTSSPHINYASSDDMGQTWAVWDQWITPAENPAIVAAHGDWPIVAYGVPGTGSSKTYWVYDHGKGVSSPNQNPMPLRTCAGGGSPVSMAIHIVSQIKYEVHVVFYDNVSSRMCHYIIEEDDFEDATYEYHELYWPSPPVPRRPTVVCDSFGNPFIFFAYDDDIHNQENRGYIYYWDGESDDATKLMFAEGWDGTAYIEDPTILLTWVAPDQCTWPRGEIHAKRGLLKYIGNGSGKLQPWITWVTSGDYEVIDPNVDMGEVQPMGTNAALWQSQINVHFSARDEDGRDPSNPWIPRIPMASHARCPQSALEPELYTYATAWTKGDAAPYSIEVNVDELSGIPGGNWGDVHVASPNGGERWSPGETRTITWYSSEIDNVYNRWKIYLSTDGGVTWPDEYPYKQNANNLDRKGNLYACDFYVPWVNSSQCRIKVYYYPYPHPYDISDENFKIGWGDPYPPDYYYISGPQPPGTQRGIYWEQTSAMGLQGIGFGYSTDNGGSWNDPTMFLSGSLYSPDDSLLMDTLFNADSTDTAYLYKYWGTIDWTIPNTPTSAAKIKLTAYDTLGDTASHVQTTSFVIPLPGGWEKNTYSNQEVWGLNDAGNKMGLFYTGRNPADTLKPIIYYTESPDGYSLDVPDSIAIGLFPCHQQGETFWLSRARDTIFYSYWDNAIPNWSNHSAVSADEAGVDFVRHSPVGIDLDADTVHIVFEKRWHQNTGPYDLLRVLHYAILKDAGTIIELDTLLELETCFENDKAPSVQANGGDVYLAYGKSGSCYFAEKIPSGQFSMEPIGSGNHPLIALTEGNVSYTYLAPDGKSLIRLWRYRDDSVWVDRDTFTLTDSLGFLTGQDGILYSAQVGDTSICKTYLYDPLGQRLIRRATYQGGYPHSYLWRCSDDQWTECYTAYLDTFRFVKTETNDLNAFFPSLYQEAKLRRSPYTAYRDTCVEYRDCTVDYGADSLVYGFSRLNPARSYAVMVEFYFESETDTTISVLANVGGTVDTIEVPNNSYVWHQVKLPPVSSSFTLKLMSLSGGFVSVSRLAVGQVDASHIMSAGGVKLEPEQPISFCLYQPFPNPFGDAATIRYSVPYAVHVNLKVYDVSGRMVTKLVDGEVDPGLHTLRWEGKDDINRRCASGVYFVRFAAEDYVASKKMVLLK